MKTIGLVLASWLHYYARFMREALTFYYRLLTNKVGLPKWVWLLMVVSWGVIVGVYLATGK